MKTLPAVVGMILVGGLGAAVGFAIATTQARNVWGPVLLQHASAVVTAAETSALAGTAEQQALQLDILSTLAQVALLRPDVSKLDAYALDGLCLLHRAVEKNTVGFTEKELEIVELTRPYLQKSGLALKARVASTDPLFLRPGCRAAQPGIQPDGPASGGSAG